MLGWSTFRKYICKKRALKWNQGCVKADCQKQADEHHKEVVDTGESASLKSDTRFDIRFIPFNLKTIRTD